MMKLVAVGNRFMKDDGIGIIVAEQLRDRLTDLKLDIIIGETDCGGGFYLLNDNDFVIILDAFYIGSEPGSVHMFSIHDVLLQPSGSVMQHDMSMIELMKLYNCKWRGYIIGIEAADIGFGDELSPILKEKFPQICWEIESTIKNILMEESEHA
ncbi:MAG: hydrogenase maturation protease [Eubacteriales bacterium]|nr:hydrogenase maturation protease [Eubacteriales bacterium]